MTLITISIDESKLPPHTESDFNEWIRFCMHDEGQLSFKNPLAREPLNAQVKVITHTPKTILKPAEIKRTFACHKH